MSQTTHSEAIATDKTVGLMGIACTKRIWQGLRTEGLYVPESKPLKSEFDEVRNCLRFRFAARADSTAKSESEATESRMTRLRRSKRWEREKGISNKSRVNAKPST